jgi:hypothetical protein
MSLSFVLLATVAVADTLTLRDGRRITGTIVSIAERMITFKDQRGVTHRYDAKQVDSITFTPSAGRNAEMPPARRFETLPSGTDLDLRTSEDVGTSTARLNQTYAAVVDLDIVGDSKDAHAIGGCAGAGRATSAIACSMNGAGVGAAAWRCVGGSMYDLMTRNRQPDKS